MNERIAQLIKQYRELVWEFRKREYPHPTARDAKDRQLATAYLKWCGTHDADAMAFLRNRFEYLNATFKQIPLFGRLCSDKQLEVWKKGPEWRALSKRASDAAAATQDPAFVQTIRDLTFLLPGHEQFRQRHILNGLTYDCMNNPQYSGGYHPKSKFCTNCPHGIECNAEINGRWNFNVAALRSQRYDLIPDAVAKAAILSSKS